MKQGKATVSGALDRKREPISKAISEEAVGTIGASVSFVKDKLNEGRGYSAPQPQGRTVHPSGTQGKHK
jgi:hypothetical protein